MVKEARGKDVCKEMGLGWVLVVFGWHRLGLGVSIAGLLVQTEH